MASRRVVADGTIAVTGLDELRKALKSLEDKNLVKELGAANQRVAALVVSRARGNAASRMESSAAGRVSASKSAVSSRVTMGGKPYDLGAEFGAGQNRPRSRKSGSYRGYNQFKPWRGSGEGAGYFLYPAVRDSREDLMEAYANEIDRIWSAGG